MPGYLESILDISESCDYFFALECCQRKVDSCWKGGAFLKMSSLAWERLFAFRATLVGRDFSNAHVKPSARQRGASVTRMEFDATPVAIRIGAVTIMTMISSKQSIALDMYFHFHQSSWVLQLAALMVFKIQQWSLSLLCVMASCRSATFTFY